VHDENEVKVGRDGREVKASGREESGEEEEEDEEEEEEQKERADGMDSDDSSVEFLRMTSISIRPVPNETPMQAAERALSNTSDNIDGLSRTHCRWREYNAVLKDTRTGGSSHNKELSKWWSMRKSEQKVCSQEADGFAVYGDMCDRHSRLLLGLYVIVSWLECAGMGLFTCWLRKENEVICEYRGDIRLERDADATLSDDLSPGSGKYAIDLPFQPPEYEGNPHERYVIDANRTWDCYARYANDASLGVLLDANLCNCTLLKGERLKPRRGRQQIFLRAEKEIAPDTELTVPYGPAYWTEAVRQSVHNAQTHAVSCRCISASSHDAAHCSMSGFTDTYSLVDVSAVSVVKECKAKEPEEEGDKVEESEDKQAERCLVAGMCGWEWSGLTPTEWSAAEVDVTVTHSGSERGSHQ